MILRHPTAILILKANGDRSCTGAHSPRHDKQVPKMHAIHAASLRAEALGLDKAEEKQETPGTGIPEGLTVHNLKQQEATAASAQYSRSR